MIDGFEWDESKSFRNISKHGVAFEEAATAFMDVLALTIPDPDHSKRELREILIGRSVYGQMVVVSFTMRRNKIRIISARKANNRERRQYEKGT